MANQFSSNLKSLTTRAITAGMKTLLHLFVIAAALFIFVGSAHSQCSPGTSPCILVSDFESRQISVWPDAGGNTAINLAFLSGCTSPYCAVGAGGGGEGVACLAGHTNQLYVTDAGNYVNTFNLSNGQFLPGGSAYVGQQAVGLVANAAGTALYVGVAGSPYELYSLGASASGLMPGPYINDPISAAVAIGSGYCSSSPNVPCAYDGNVFTSWDSVHGVGVNEYIPGGTYLQPLTPVTTQFLPDIPPVGNSNCRTFGTSQMHCWNALRGLAFDAYGNLWINSVASGDNGTFTFAPPPPGSGFGCGAPVCPLYFTPDTGLNGGGGQSTPTGLTVAPANDPSNPGAILIANYDTQSVNIIRPSSCHGSLANPGTCTESTFIEVPAGGRPKFVVYNVSCPDPDTNGYLEICKQSNPNSPVTGTFDFTASAPLFSSGTVEVPVGECSGPLEVPDGQITVTEAPTIGDLVSDVTACSYNEFGECVPDLVSWTLPDLYATVPVATGGVSSETLTTFTNYAASPGQLKVCKIAGLGTPVGTEFTFTVTGIPPFQVQAGPPGQGGFCQLVAGTFPVNTPVTIAETPNAGYPLTSATVECNACTYSVNLPQSSVTTTIGAGITVASFTNTKSNGGCLICRNPGIE